MKEDSYAGKIGQMYREVKAFLEERHPIDRPPEILKEEIIEYLRTFDGVTLEPSQCARYLKI